METEIKTKTRQFLAQRFRNHDLQDDQDIFTLGFVNSLFAMQLIVFVEQEFNIAVDDEDMDIDNFRSVNALTRLVLSKNGAK
jgi:acyl carrier protein